ncbi:DUF4309 domain-containing protein [Sporosarcina aquimarina]|uniref:DUF4309 domain-containing protein n=1 Tax=Sporosarcina aquimarina TaxID=114975 RepID=UPI00203B0691|nr:DUF4309 domain-containing protein [Sporosarcina aquimarina]MCM3757102.1 DUF4309 domain-containing protein [Sporosarcina aquimarina]
MKQNLLLLTMLLSGGLAACSASPTDETTDSTQQEMGDSVQNETGGNAAGQNDEEEQTSNNEQSEADETQDSQNSEETTSSEADENKDHSSHESTADESIDKEQKKMAIDTLNDLVLDGKKGKVYHLNDNFYVGKTTQTDVYNTIGKPERKDTFDRYTGSMGQASYDLRYNEKGLLVEARYLGTNVERQTNLGGISSKDLVEQLGNPDEKRMLEDSNQTSYIYELGSYEIQFVMTEKDNADHVNLLLVS